jgi:hypothetical protein
MYSTVAGDGVVAVHQGGQVIAEAKVASGHTFRLSVPDGSYRITSSCVQPAIPMGQELPTRITVAPNHITVTAHRSTLVRVTCYLETTVG